MGDFFLCKNVSFSTNNKGWKENGHQQWKLSWNIYTMHTDFCIFVTDLHAQSLLINKISTSELSRKLNKSGLLVG